MNKRTQKAQVGDIVHKHISLFPFRIMAISREPIFPTVRMESLLTGRVIEVEAYELADFYPEREPLW